MKLPFDVVKIGSGYTAKLISASDDRDTVRRIVREVHQLGRIVAAEGVASEDHFNQVKALGCDYCQGPFVSEKLDDRGVLEVFNESLAWKRGMVEE